jgi:hypothetical protein
MNPSTKILLALAMTLGAVATWAAPPSTAPTTSTAKPVAPPPAAAQPAAMPPLKGEVLEAIDAPPYTYLRLKTSGGETWAAVLKAPVKKGTQVAVENPMVMTNFQSKTLNRTFDKIVFGTLAGAPPSSGNVTAAQMAPAAAAAPGAGSMPMASSPASPHAGMAAASPEKAAPMEKVAKAAGPDARTVAEAFAQSAKLSGKDVVVRAKVVKFLPSIMGKNWVHLQDGSGSAADGTNDLTANTKQTVKVGDVVVAKGVLRTDVDVGMGSKYKALLEDATFQK